MLLSAEATKKRLDDKIDLIVEKLIPSIIEQINKAADNHQNYTTILTDNINVCCKICDQLQKAKYTVKCKETKKYRKLKLLEYS